MSFKAEILKSFILQTRMKTQLSEL